MKITSKREFKASAGQLWQIVCDPGNMPAWNPKCTSSTSVMNARVGDTFDCTFQRRQKTYDAHGEIIEVRPNEKITLRMHYEHDAMLGSVDESFEIKQKNFEKALLIHTVDFSRSTLPFWVKILIGFLGRFGRKQGPDSLDNIQGLIK